MSSPFKETEEVLHGSRSWVPGCRKTGLAGSSLLQPAPLSLPTLITSPCPPLSLFLIRTSPSVPIYLCLCWALYAPAQKASK